MKKIKPEWNGETYDPCRESLLNWYEGTDFYKELRAAIESGEDFETEIFGTECGQEYGKLKRENGKLYLTAYHSPYLDWVITDAFDYLYPSLHCPSEIGEIIGETVYELAQKLGIPTDNIYYESTIPDITDWQFVIDSLELLAEKATEDWDKVSDCLIGLVKNAIELYNIGERVTGDSI